jgi:hypothetical protein
MSRIRTCLSLSLLLAAVAAHAADPAAQARDLFVKGQQAMAAGRYTDALANYQGSYKVSNAPTVLFFIGEAYRASGDDAKALATYEEYLAKLPNAPKKVDAEARIAELKTKIANKPKMAISEIDLNLDTTPPKTAAQKKEEKREAAEVKKAAGDDLAMDDLKPAKPAKKLTKKQKRALAAKEAADKAAAEKAAALKAAADKAAADKAAADQAAADKAAADQAIADKIAADRAAQAAADRAAADRAAQQQMNVRPSEGKLVSSTPPPPPGATSTTPPPPETAVNTTMDHPQSPWVFSLTASVGIGALSHSGFAGYPTPVPGREDSAVVPVESLDISLGYRVGRVAIGLFAEGAIAGKPDVFANDLLVVFSVGPRVEIEAGMFRIGLFGSKVFLPQQDALSFNFSVGGDVGLQFGHWGVRLGVSYVGGTGDYPIAAGAASTSNTVSMVPVTLGLHWVL